MSGVLIIGYGNPLRGDDGVGFNAAWLLSLDPRLRGADVLIRQQLTPELAEDIARAALVVLIDASAGGSTPGTVSVRRIDAGQVNGTPWTHSVDPSVLAVLADELYGRVPPIMLVSVEAASMEPGRKLSPPVARALPEIVETVARLVKEHVHA